MNNSIEVATLAGGCFWCIETTMKRLKGVQEVISGYTGGKISNPTYREVCSGLTGHAEAVKITFDNTVIDYNTILKVFFAMHDPTTLNRQGADIGTQYRSAIYFHSELQKKQAHDLIAQLEKDEVFSNIVTEISPAEVFYIAEDYHQNYYELNRTQNAYCTAVIDPKVNKLRKSFAHLLQQD